MEIALFGTSADPPTHAHQQAIQWLSQQFALVAVWAADNPDKTHVATLAQRTAMLELLVAELPASGAKVYPELSDRYTINTLHKAQALWPHARFSLAIGSDLVAQIEHWHRAAELLAEVDLLIIPRPGWRLPEQVWQRLQRSERRRTIVTELATADVSSSALRRSLQDSNSDSGLTPAVRNYIQTAGLYAASVTS
jgi:nicotinate-nucleotide adenylyltransferase